MYILNHFLITSEVLPLQKNKRRTFLFGNRFTPALLFASPVHSLSWTGLGQVASTTLLYVYYCRQLVELPPQHHLNP